MRNLVTTIAPADVGELQWIEVDSDRLAENIRTFRRHLGSNAQLAPVIKSNAYGHGLAIAARAFAAGGADWFCVHSFAEAEAARGLDLGLPVLILGPLAADEVRAAVAAGHHITAYDPVRLSQLEAAGATLSRPVPVHLKVETGTWRQGAAGDDLIACLETLRNAKWLELVALSSHFANIEDTTDHSYAQSQRERFEEIQRAAAASGLSPRMAHMSCSAASILFPVESRVLARVGISAYGYWPSSATHVSAQQQHADGLDLGPALCWKTRVAQVKDVPAGSYIGYGCTEKIEIDSRIAILPVGYADGFSRSFSGKAHVLIDGRRCPVRGRVCMNLTMVDVTHLDQVVVEDEAVLLGKQGQEELRAETLADWGGTIHYEILAGLSLQIPRRPAG